ncbi:ferric reduction oxidase 2-like isoform X1 [Triticum dicoccoides]|uniref:ferric reduction oxidase 2-like isoform X1 n=1 Tax=Triticum dicoccoides TaxID=85692 RepID=UPI00188FC61D|nr:ferric reduction oxidase 2-like isoform X1 [Triticum dicoccoides]
MDNRTLGKGRKCVPSPSAAAVVRSAVLLLAAVVFVGWLMMWAMLPTRTYSSTWAPKLAALTGFGKQGIRMTVYVFPVLFVYVVACVYLHLQQKGGDPDTQRRSSTRMASWRRPVLVRGPLGIVTSIELAILLMFMALLVWFYYAYIAVEFSKLRVKPGEKLWQAELEKAAKRLGSVGSLCCALLFLPVARGSSLLPLIGLTPEAGIKYHVWLGNMAMAFFTAHGLCYVFFWASTDQIHLMTKWARTRASNVAGELALLCGLAMWATALPRIRRRVFELFFYAHHLYIPFIVFSALHMGVTVFWYVLPGVFLFAVDRCLRFLQSRARIRLVSSRLLPSGAVELNFDKSPSKQRRYPCKEGYEATTVTDNFVADLRYNPTSTLFVNVPCVSRLQWHPFSVTSSSSLEPDTLSVVIKNRGGWTQKLYETVSSLPPSGGHLGVSVEGPYSPAAGVTSFLGHDSLVMISGGIGITPFISVIRELVYQSSVAETASTPKLLLVCVFRTSAELDMLDLLVPASGGLYGTPSLDLRIEAFVTSESEPRTGNDTHKRPCQQVWFKPWPSDAPVSPALGTNGWLWLGAVVSSSFAAFLLLVAVLQRFYIYPVDRDSNHVYPWAARTMLNLLFLGVSVAGVTGAAFLWSKRRSAREAKKIKSVDGPTPAMSPVSLLHWTGGGGVERELESLPAQPLAQATNVHFGHRPDLKRMLLGIHDENVGVMASGPSGMLEEVATICSSGLASNLHFQSISFTW